jgi:hypothetical protein
MATGRPYGASARSTRYRRPNRCPAESIGTLLDLPHQLALLRDNGSQGSVVVLDRDQRLIDLEHGFMKLAVLVRQLPVGQALNDHSGCQESECDPYRGRNFLDRIHGICWNPRRA